MQVKCDLAYNTKWEDLDWEAVKKYHPLAPEEKPSSRYAWTNMDAPIRFTDSEIAVREFLGFYEQLIQQFPQLVEAAADEARHEQG